MCMYIFGVLPTSNTSIAFARCDGHRVSPRKSRMKRKSEKSIFCARLNVRALIRGLLVIAI